MSGRRGRPGRVPPTRRESRTSLLRAASVEKTLFHFTSELLLPQIFEDGELISAAETVRRGTGIVQPRLSRWDVFVDELVWLTDEPDPSKHIWDDSNPVKKTEVRFTVRACSAIPWAAYARILRFPRGYLRGLANTGGDPRTWYVSQIPIPRASWLRVEGTESLVHSAGASAGTGVAA